MEQFADMLKTGLDWVAAAPPGVLGLILVVCFIIFLFKKVLD